MPIDIHGKQYVTVAERVKALHDSKKTFSITTKVLQHNPSVVVKATIEIDGQKFTGISAANPTKSIEKMSPYEVAETSAVGRAAGFAGYGLIDSIASADEMAKAELTSENDVMTAHYAKQATEEAPLGTCPKCGAPNMRYRTGNIGCSKFCWKRKDTSAINKTAEEATEVFGQDPDDELPF